MLFLWGPYLCYMEAEKLTPYCRTHRRQDYDWRAGLVVSLRPVSTYLPRKAVFHCSIGPLAPDATSTCEAPAQEEA
jgi:hypothetical protein